MATSPFVISGLGSKAKVPGGISNTSTNTITPKFTAPASQQTASGPNNAQVASLLTSSLPKTSPTAAVGGLTGGLAINPQTGGVTAPTKPVTTGNAPVGNYASTTTPTYSAPTQTVNSYNTAGSPGSKDIVTPTATQAPTFPGIVGDLLKASQANQTQQALLNQLSTSAGNNTAIGQSAADIASNYGQQIADVGSQAARATNTIGKTTPVVFGNNAIIAQNSAAQQQALAQAGNFALQGTGQQLTAQGQLQSGLTSALGGANTQQQQQLGGLYNAANLAAPQFGQAGQVSYNPLSASQGTGSYVSDVQRLADAVNNGTIDYNTAIGQLSGYGTAVQNQLLSAIQQKNPNFNVSQSNTLASQQGSIGPAYSFAKSALTNLQTLANTLASSGTVPGQGSNIPIINQIANSISSGTGLGSDTTRQYQQAVAEARNAYAQLLASSRGGTPTEYGNQATAAIPDNATPNDIQAAINSLESLGLSKVNIYGNPGGSQLTGTNSSGGPSLYSW